MKILGEWLLVNLFFLIIILAGAGTMLAAGTIVKILHLHGRIEFAAWFAAALLGILASYFVGSALHRALSRHFARRST